MATQKTKKQIHIEDLSRATKVARLSIFIVLGLAVIKAFGGYVTNIIALFGDALGSFSDIISGTALYIGLLLSQKKANTRFQYGFHRAETLISLFISVFILYAGYQVGAASFERFFTHVQTSSHNVGIFAALVSIGVSLSAFYYQKNMGDKINSRALLASAYDKRNDTFVSLGVLVSVVADKFNIPYVESSIGLGISALIIYTGFKYGKDAIFYLLDYWNEPAITTQITAILTKSKIVTVVKNIRLRHAGTYIFGEAFLEINPFTDSKDLRDEIHRLNAEIEKNVEHLGDLVLYIDPPKPVKVNVALPVVDDNGLESHIAEDPAAKFHFLCVEIDQGKIIKFHRLPGDFSVEKVTEIAQCLKDHQVNILISSLIRPLLYYHLRLNNIRVYPHFLEVKDAQNTIKLLLLDI